MLRITQNERPCVAITRSWSSTTRSETCVLGRFIVSFCQWAPSSHDTYTVVSEAAYSSPARAGSSRTARTKSSAGIPPSMRVHVFP